MFKLADAVREKLRRFTATLEECGGGDHTKPGADSVESLALSFSSFCAVIADPIAIETKGDFEGAIIGLVNGIRSDFKECFTSEEGDPHAPKVCVNCGDEISWEAQMLEPAEPEKCARCADPE